MERAWAECTNLNRAINVDKQREILVVKGLSFIYVLLCVPRYYLFLSKKLEITADIYKVLNLFYKSYKIYNIGNSVHVLFSILHSNHFL